jgi:predicted small secreted protein
MPASRGTALAKDGLLDPSITLQESNMIKRFLVLVSLVSITALAGCNTMHGLGEDVERGGEKIQGSAERNR